MIEFLHVLDADRAVTAGFNLTIIANAAKGEQLYDGEGGMNTGESDGMEMPKMDSAMFNQLAQQIGIGMTRRMQPLPLQWIFWTSPDTIMPPDVTRWKEKNILAASFSAARHFRRISARTGKW